MALYSKYIWFRSFSVTRIMMNIGGLLVSLQNIPELCLLSNILGNWAMFNILPLAHILGEFCFFFHKAHWHFYCFLINSVIFVCFLVQQTDLLFNCVLKTIISIKNIILWWWYISIVIWNKHNIHAKGYFIP